MDTLPEDLSSLLSLYFEPDEYPVIYIKPISDDGVLFEYEDTAPLIF